MRRLTIVGQSGGPPGAAEPTAGTDAGSAPAPATRREQEAAPDSAGDEPSPPPEPSEQPDQSAPDEAPPQPQAEEQPWERRLRGLAGVLAPTTVLTALMIYFGYVYEWAYYNYFGVDLRTLGLSNQDLLLNSVTALYAPLGALLVVSVAALWLHTYVRTLLADSRHRRAVTVLGIVTATLGALTFARGVLGVLVPEIARTEPIATSPVCLSLGATLTAYGRHLLRHRNGQLTEVAPETRGTDTGASLLVAGVTVLGLFWAATSVAHAQGRGDAVILNGILRQQPGVLLDTTERLDIQLPGMAEYALPGPTYLYRYRGLRLLARTDKALLLVTERWIPESGTTLLVPVDDRIRTSFIPGKT